VQTPPAAEVADAFVRLITPQRERKHVTEDDAFLKMIWRMVRALELRTIANPLEMLSQVVALTQRMSEIANVAIAINSARHMLNPMSAPSMIECAHAMGIKKQSASERKKIGERVIAERLTAANAARLDTYRKLKQQERDEAEIVKAADRAYRFAEARREADVINAAHEYAVTQIAEYRARHRAA
jgi:hypothetical protein